MTEYFNINQAKNYFHKDYYVIKRVFDLAEKRKETFYEMKSKTFVGTVRTRALPKAVIIKLYKEIYRDEPEKKRR